MPNVRVLPRPTGRASRVVGNLRDQSPVELEILKNVPVVAGTRRARVRLSRIRCGHTDLLCNELNLRIE